MAKHSTGIDAIGQALGVTEYNRSGWSSPVKCPFPSHYSEGEPVFHEQEDRALAFYWNPFMGIGRCWRHNEVYSARQIAEALFLYWNFNPRMTASVMDQVIEAEGGSRLIAPNEDGGGMNVYADMVMGA